MDDWRAKLHDVVRDQHERLADAAADRRREAAAPALHEARVTQQLDQIIVPGIDLVAAALAEDDITLSHERRPRELFIQAGPTEVITIARPGRSATTMVIVPRLEGDEVGFRLEGGGQVADLKQLTPEAVAAAIADGYAARLAE